MVGQEKVNGCAQRSHLVTVLVIVLRATRMMKPQSQFSLRHCSVCLLVVGGVVALSVQASRTHRRLRLRRTQAPN